jgi:hypothetical protein
MSETTAVEQPTTLQQEIAKAEYEPLLPVEKKLIGWSLGTGIVLLVVLSLTSRYF